MAHTGAAPTSAAPLSGHAPAAPSVRRTHAPASSAHPPPRAARAAALCHAGLHAATQPHPSRHATLRRGARLVVASAPNDDSSADDAVGLGDLVELQLAGFCCSAHGFIALLTPRGVALPLPPAPNLVERLRGASPEPPPQPAPPPGAPALALALRMTSDPADAHAPNSVAALTLLQLAQSPPIDMGGVLLPYDALARLTGEEESLLGAVIVATAGDAAVESADTAGSSGSKARGFEATLLAGGAGAPGAFAARDAWLAVALALRYAPYGARLFAAPAALAASGVALADVAAAFPTAVSAEDVRAEGSAATEALRRAFTAAARDAER